MEHILTSQLVIFAKGTDLLHTNHHGFKRNHECEKQLIELTTDITNNLDDEQETDACILDFSKTFHKVNHNKHLKKWTHYGNICQLIEWIQDFHSGRTQKVLVD